MPAEGAEEWLTSEDKSDSDESGANKSGADEDGSDELMKSGQRTPTGSISPTSCSRRMCT